MDDIYLPRTIESPEVNFQFSNDVLSISGEAYPENASEFFHPLLNALDSYLKSVDGREIEFNFSLTYFNSASTKMLYTMFEMLNETACTSNRVTLNWFHDQDDDTTLEFGESVQDDFKGLEYRPISVNDISKA